MKGKFLAIFFIIILFASTLNASNMIHGKEYTIPSEIKEANKTPINNVFYLDIEKKSSSLSITENIALKGVAGDFKILIDEGHGQYYSGERLETLKNLITAYFGSYIVNTDNFTESDFDGIDLVIIPNPEGNFTDEEVTLLQNYVEEGGSVLVMATWSTYFEPYSYNKFTNKYGIYWNDTSIVDETDNFGGPYAQYQIKVHVWDSNTIVDEMGVANYISEAYFDGTAITTGPYNSDVVVDGPYFVGLPDDDTYILLPDGTSLVPGVNYTKPFGFHTAVKLINGGKIFASGSTREIADPYIEYGDTYNFVKLVLAWLLDVTPEDVLMPEIKNLVAPDAVKPGLKYWINFSIENNVPINRSEMKLKVYIPYFMKVDGKASFVSDKRDESLTIIPGDFVDLGTIYSGERINVSIRVVGALGLETSGVITILLYSGNVLVSSATKSVYSAPTINVSAEFSPFYINVSRTNTSLLVVNITNAVGYTVKGINISVEVLPENLEINATSYLIDSLEPGDKVTKTFSVEIAGVGVYEVSLVIRDLNGTSVVRRPFLLGITQKLIVFDEGHYQYIRFASPYMKGLIEILKEYGPVLINKGEFPPAILDPLVTNLIVIPVPQPSTASPSDTTTPIFTEEEITYLQKFVDNGGSLLLMGNWYMYFWPDNPNSLNDLTEPYGIKWIDGDLYDRVNNLGPPYQVVLKNFANNSVARFMSSGVDEIHYSGTGLLQIEPTKPVTLYPILLGNEESFVTTGPIDAENVTVGLDCILVMAAETEGGGRIIASGSSYMFSDYYYFQQNADFIRNMVAWLSKISKLTLEPSPIPAELPLAKPIAVKIRVKNSGVQKLTDVALDIPEIPVGKVELLNSSRIEIGDLEPGEFVDVVLVFKGKSEGSYVIQINALVEDKVRESIKLVLNFVAVEKGPNWVLIAGGLVGLVIILAIAFKFILPSIRKK